MTRLLTKTLDRTNILLVLFFILLSCNSQTKQSSISKIKIISIMEGVQTSLVVGCGLEFMIEPVLMEDTIIRDNDFTKKFEHYFNNLLPSANSLSSDMRILCLINYNNKSVVDTLCFGEFSGICLNGEQMQSDSLFLNFIKKTVYPHKKSLLEKMLEKENAFPN